MYVKSPKLFIKHSWTPTRNIVCHPRLIFRTKEFKKTKIDWSANTHGKLSELKHTQLSQISHFHRNNIQNRDISGVIKINMM